MAEVIRMPKMSDTMEEGVIAAWHVKVGDEVKSGDILAEVETDKATMELESYEEGVLLHIGVEEKDSVPVDGVIAIIGEKDENIDDLLKDLEKGDKAETKVEGSKPAEEEPADEVDASDVNASLILMPKMSDTMTEGTIASWQKKVGDEVKSGDILAEIETDKATMELEAYEDGTLLYIGADEGSSVAVDEAIAIIGEKGADYEKLLKSHKAKGGKEKKEEKSELDQLVGKEPAPEPAKAESSAPKAQPAPAVSESASSGEDGRLKVSPLARKIAQEKGYDLANIKGSGDNGRIIKRDVEAYEPQPEPAPAAQEKADQGKPSFTLPEVVGEEKFEEVNVSQMRKTIAKRLAESKYTAPHFYLTMEINMDRAVEARKSLNDFSPVKISFNDIILKAAAAALRQHPKVNASWQGDKIRRNKHIHIGVAVAVEEGLLVPVVRFADNKSLAHIAAEVKELGQKAKNKQLQPKEWEGNTFSISNLGMFGIEEFTAIINPPDSCILAVGGIKQTPIVKEGEMKIGHVMKVTLSCDHRVVDGATGAAFLQTLKGLLEDPIRIMI
ncbi:MAG: pyruvate dehydrogenase complex dihydrolipoamide acetyltransferase [Candidatus Cyclobacteriaceae bacterium M3_2C_046]